MIIVRLHNGLGNQMFQYAAGLALARQHHTQLKLDISWFDNPTKEKHEVYGLRDFDIVEHFATKRECLAFLPKPRNRLETWITRTAQRLRIETHQKTHYFQRQWGFDPQFFELPADTYLDGYFQHPSYLTPVEEELRTHFTFKSPHSEKISFYLELIRSSSPSVFLHVRRQDYVKANLEFGPLTWDYYLRSLAEMHKRLRTFTVFIFSDDVDFVEREFKLDYPHHFIRTSGPSSAIDELQLMSSCNHAIISNSTFSWWGAWLNPSPNKTVIAPRPWHADIDPQFRDLKPALASWLSIDRADPLAVSNF